MRLFRPRLTVRRLMAAIAFLAVSLGLIRLHSDSPAHRFHAEIRVDFPSIASPEQSGNTLTPQIFQDRVSELTSPAVLDAALADAHLSTTPRIYNAVDPRAELRRMIDVQADHRARVAWMTIEGRIPIEPVLAAQPLADAVLSKGPAGVRVTRAPVRLRTTLAPAVLDRRWKVAAAAFVSILATVLILVGPAGFERPTFVSQSATGDPLLSGYGKGVARRQCVSGERVPPLSR
jgi:hypothetical protein